MTSFEPGKTYKTRSICDSNCWFSITVASRTAKTIKTTEGKTLRVGSYDGAETVKSPTAPIRWRRLSRRTGDPRRPEDPAFFILLRVCKTQTHLLALLTDWRS